VPHIHLETTADLPENADVPDILEALVATISGQETVTPASIKAYHTLRSNWAMGEGAPAGFAHCTLMVLTGRPVELRRKMAEAAMATLREHFKMSLEASEVSLTLEVREMEAATYLTAK
jgi:5-carboxymethyl-2-hydroxymuconate isomerase